jgi:autotransporter-associated beta strand protein
VLGAVTVAASTATPYTLTSTATEGGTVNPSGALTVSSGTNQTFTFTPNDRRKITDVKVDGVSVGTAASYIFSNVTAPHTVAVTFGVDTAPVVWTGGGAADTWIAAANWANGVTPLYYDENVVFAGTARLTPQLGSATDLGIGAARTLRSLTFADTAGSFVLGSANNVGLGLTGGLTNNSANTQTINLPLYIGNTTTTFDTPAGDVVVNAGIAGIGGLSKTGGGTLTLVGASYSGTTTVNAGTLKLTAWNTLDSRTVVRLQTGGLLNLNFNGEQTVSALFLDGVRQVSGTWGASGSGAEHASTLLSGTGVLRIISGTGAFNWNTGDGDWNTATANWSGLGTMWTDGANAANFSLANTNDLVLKVTVSATRTAGAVTIGNGCNNAYTMFSGGTLNASSFLVQGFGGNGWWAGWSTPATLNNLTLNVSGNLGVGCWSLVIGGSSAVSVAGVIGSGGIVSSPGWAMLQLQDSAAVTVAGGVNGNSDCFGLRLNGGTLTTPSIQASDRVEFGPPWDWDPARLTFNGTTVIASSNNSAFVTVGANPGSTFSAVVGNNGAIFDSNGHDIGIPVNLESNGSGGLTKLGAGTLTLSGANTYSGATAVRAGTLACSSPGALASNAVVIANGATLNLNYTGTRQIASLTFGTSLQPANTYGSASSPAPVKDARFTGTGMVTVGVRQGVFNQTITFGTLPTKTYGDTPFELTATANSGLAVTYASSDPAVARVSGSTVTILKAGSATFTASQAGDANYNAATPVAQALTVNPASQVINFGTLLAKTYGDPPFELTATANSGLAVTYVSSDPAVARVSGSTVTILKAGSVTLTASQAGDANYNAAAPVEQTLAVDKITPVITWSTPAALAAGTALDDTQLNAASGGVAGTFVYTPPAGTVLAVGAVHTLSVQFTPSDTVNYNTPAAQNVTLMVLAATPTGLAEDFERVWADNALANTTNGWTSGLEDLSTVTNPVAGYAALPGDILFPILYDHAAKKRLLRLNTQEATLATPALAAGFAQAKVYVDMMVNLCADDYLPGMDSNRLNAKTFVCLKNDGVTTNLYVFHGQKGPDGFGAPVFSAVTNLVVSGTWYRLTVVFDSTSGAGGDAEAFSVLLNGKPLFSFAAYGDGWKTRVFGDPCTPDGGSWFLSAARHSGTAATNLNRVIGVTFNGAGLIDDLVVTSHQPAFLRGTLIIIR